MFINCFSVVMEKLTDPGLFLSQSNHFFTESQKQTGCDYGSHPPGQPAMY